MDSRNNYQFVFFYFSLLWLIQAHINEQIWIIHEQIRKFTIMSQFTTIWFKQNEIYWIIYNFYCRCIGVCFVQFQLKSVKILIFVCVCVCVNSKCVLRIFIHKRLQRYSWQNYSFWFYSPIYTIPKRNFLGKKQVDFFPIASFHNVMKICFAGKLL